MTSKKGRSLYCPPELIIELDNLKKAENLPDSNPVAMRELVRFSRIGRAVKQGGVGNLPEIAPRPKKKRKSFDGPFQGLF